MHLHYICVTKILYCYTFVMSSILLHFCSIIFIMQTFGERLRDLRQEKGLSLIDLAKLTQISNATLCRWENNIVDIKGKELVVLAKFFNVTTDYLLGLEM